MKTIVKTAALAGLLAATAACLVKDTRHTLYLDPDGRLEWTALETDVHAEGGEPAALAAEEEGYLADVQSGESGVYRAFRSLGALQADCRILRDRRPYAVWTEARFASLDAVGQTVLDRFGVPGQATLRTEKGETCFELVCYPDRAVDNAGEDAKTLEALVEGFDRYRIVLTRGRFTAATGFRLEDNGRSAIPVEPDKDAVLADGGAVRFALRWQDAER
jgi:hypothetical protein